MDHQQLAEEMLAGLLLEREHMIGTPPRSGYLVAGAVPLYEIPLRKVTLEHIESFIKENEDTIGFVTGWVHPDTGDIQLGVSEVYETIAEAIRVAEGRGEPTVLDLDFEEILAVD